MKIKATVIARVTQKPESILDETYKEEEHLSNVTDKRPPFANITDRPPQVVISMCSAHEFYFNFLAYILADSAYAGRLFIREPRKTLVVIVE